MNANYYSLITTSNFSSFSHLWRRSPIWAWTLLTGIFEALFYLMSSKYKFDHRQDVYFVTSAIVHENPERAGFVRYPIDWKHSSAIDYYSEAGKGLLELVRLD